MKIQTKYYPYQVPEELYLQLEKEAIKRRKATGENVNWSNIVKEIIEQYFNSKKK